MFILSASILTLNRICDNIAHQYLPLISVLLLDQLFIYIIIQIIVPNEISMPKVFVEFLEGNNIYACSKCGTHLSPLGQLVSKAFRGQHGSAYLFNSVINVTNGKSQRKRLTTGLHTVCDIFCVVCGTRAPVGWKYVKQTLKKIAAEQQDQKYKQGRFILEQALIDKAQWNAD